MAESVRGRYLGLERHEVTGEWRKLQKEELHDLYASPNIIWVIKTGRIEWLGRIARIEDRTGVNWFWWEILREKRPPGRPRTESRIILQWIFNKWDNGAWTAVMWLRIGTCGRLM